MPAVRQKLHLSSCPDFRCRLLPLTPFWTAILQELYENVGFRHRFDIIQVILNQDPHSLVGIEQHVQRPKGVRVGDRRGDTAFSRYKIGARTFVLIFHLSKHSIDQKEWHKRARILAMKGAVSMFEATDCAVFGKSTKSKEWTYDAVSFFRMGRLPTPSAVPTNVPAD